MRILLVEDDKLIGDGIKTGLGKMGFSIDWFTRGEEGKIALYSAPYDAVILVSPKRADDARLLGALRPLVGSISVEAMRAANYSVDRDRGKLSPAQAARALEPSK